MENRVILVEVHEDDFHYGASYLPEYLGKVGTLTGAAPSQFGCPWQQGWFNVDNVPSGLLLRGARFVAEVPEPGQPAPKPSNRVITIKVDKAAWDDRSDDPNVDIEKLGEALMIVVEAWVGDGNVELEVSEEDCG